jgi:CheY-like chemotaxis protein
MMNKRILVVDDDQQIQSFLQEFLQEEGYEVETASDGLLALEQLACQPSYQVILLDLCMPRMDGFQFLQALRPHPEVSLPLIIAYSGSPKALEQAAQMGHRASVLAKPFDLEHLLALIMTHETLM